MYRLCAIDGCGKIGNAPVHRGLGPLPKRRHVLPSELHPFNDNGRHRCQTCGKARQSSRHRGLETKKRYDTAGLRLLTQEDLRPEPIRAPEPVQLGAMPVMLIALGYSEALQGTPGVPAVVRMYAVQLSRAIGEAMGRTEIVAHRDPVVIPTAEAGEEPRSMRRPIVHIQAGTPAIRRSFRSGRVRALFDRAIESGWTWRRTGGGHILLDSPGQKQHVSLSTTLSDKGTGRGWLNTLADAKRKGLDTSGL
jgi:hypothetical protein